MAPLPAPLSLSLSTAEGSRLFSFELVCRLSLRDTISRFSETERIQLIYYIKPHYVCRLWPRGCKTRQQCHVHGDRNLHTCCVYRFGIFDIARRIFIRHRENMFRRVGLLGWKEAIFFTFLFLPAFPPSFVIFPA